MKEYGYLDVWGFLQPNRTDAELYMRISVKPNVTSVMLIVDYPGYGDTYAIEPHVDFVALPKQGYVPRTRNEHLTVSIRSEHNCNRADRCSFVEISNLPIGDHILIVGVNHTSPGNFMRLFNVFMWESVC